jgi:NIMA (never in mitosis gene a)-related kinase
MSLRDYKVIKELGAGAFGTVVLVQKGNSKYCVKKVDVRRMPAKEREAAIKEAKVLKKFNHPNIVQYVDQFIEDGTLCIVMELAEDGDLHARLKKQRGRPLKEDIILNWFVQICLAMKHVHDRKVLHRDIKTQNIFLTRGGTVIKVRCRPERAQPGLAVIFPVLHPRTGRRFRHLARA